MYLLLCLLLLIAFSLVKVCFCPVYDTGMARGFK